MIPSTQHATPNLSEFNPHVIPYQYEVIKLVRNFDYSKGVLEVLLSGSLGSAKSILMAHLACTHVMLYPRSRFLLGRKALPDLKDTLINKIDEHLEGVLIAGKDYKKEASTGHYVFKNGSEFISRSWADKNFTRFRSLELSGAAIEELTENDGEYFEAIKTIRTRIGRLPHVRENIMISATNPDSPSHPAHKYYIESDSMFRRVFYSNTFDNPFLPKWYIDQLFEVYDKKEIQRFIYGKWIEIKRDQVYHAFNPNLSVIDNYSLNPGLPVCMSFDFNIGVGKPLSVCFFQVYNGHFYFFDEVVLERTITRQAVEEAMEKGIIRPNMEVIVHGDATGRSRSTKAIHSDYEEINEVLSAYKVNFVIDVPIRNPPVRKRHVIVNGLLENAKGETKIHITKNCKTLIEGFRLTRLVKGAGYLEDDSPSCPFQHITTAAGYGIIAQTTRMELSRSGKPLSF